MSKPVIRVGPLANPLLNRKTNKYYLFMDYYTFNNVVNKEII